VVPAFTLDAFELPAFTLDPSVLPAVTIDPRVAETVYLGCDDPTHCGFCDDCQAAIAQYQ
jgi:hypothetical protein